MKLSTSLILTALAGALYALCYPSEFGNGWFPLLFISLPFFLWRLEESGSVKLMILHVFIYNLGFNISGYYWIPHTLREFGQLPYIVSLILGGLFSFILQPHWWVYIIWKKYRPAFQWKSETGVLVTAVVMTILERFFPQQFPSFVGGPWLHLAPYIGLAPYFGVVLFSFVTYWICLEAYTQLETKKLRPQVWITFFLFVVLNAVMPLKDRYTDKTLPVRIVQANVGNFLKVQSEKGDANSFQSIRQRYENLSITNNGFSPKLIVWPETAYPNTFYGEQTELEDIFHTITKETGSEILIGGYDQDMTKNSFDFIESVFNSSILIRDQKVASTYHKNILIPFGETLPFGPFNRQIVSIVPAVSLFARGTGTPVMETRDQNRFVTPICYEILESNYMRSLLNQHGKNQFIVNHTNDSWYGKTAEPYQHLFLSKWRAVEFNLAIVRSTNTGITSVIYPDSSESKRLEIYEEGVLDVNVPLGNGDATIYQTWGMIPTLLLIALLMSISIFRSNITSEEKN